MSKIENPEISDVLYEVCAKEPVKKTLRTEIQEDLEEMLPNEDHSVLERALSEQMQVYPDVNPLYKVISFSSSSPSIYYVNLEDYTCSCEYYLYNCTESEKYCKHIWRILGLIKYNYLPDNKKSTYQWVFNNLVSDINETFEDNNIDKYQKLQELEKILSTEGPSNIVYEYIFYKWTILKMPSETIPDPIDFLNEYDKQSIEKDGEYLGA